MSEEYSIYISGPMEGLPDRNCPTFDAAEDRAISLGWSVFNPACLDNKYPGQSFSFYLGVDLEMLLHCDAIALLPGWQHSRGARLEVAIASALGYPFYSATTFLPYRNMEEVRLVGRMTLGDDGCLLSDVPEMTDSPDGSTATRSATPTSPETPQPRRKRSKRLFAKQ